MAAKLALCLFIAVTLSLPLASQSAVMGIPAIARRANGAVMLIEGESQDGKTTYDGTGFVVRPDGVVVTNYHVIAQDASAIAKLPDGAYFPVRGVLAADPKRDIAVLKLDATELSALNLGNSAQVQVGQEVVAIGNPESLESSVSIGIISGVRDDATLGGRFLQITAPISHGSSGGPLFDMHGRVIGITSMYVEGGENLNFAIPINTLMPLLRHLPVATVPLPGATPIAAAADVPAAQTKAAAAPHGPEYSQGYVDGYFAGMSEGYKLAATPTRPKGKPALYVESSVSDGDTVGAAFVYDLKSAIASSALYTLADSQSAAAFEVAVVTVSANDGLDTAGAIVIECGGSSAVRCAAGEVVDTFAFLAGSDKAGPEAEDMMASIDQSISALPAKTP